MVLYLHPEKENGTNMIFVTLLNEAKSFGLNLPPAFRLVDPRKYNISEDFNYASSSARILSEIATNIFKGIISLVEQVDMFKRTKRLYLPLHLNSKASISGHISNSIFLVVMGINDIRLNFLKKVNSTYSHKFANELDFLVEKLGNRLTNLYDLGARKFVVFEVEALGCLPFYVNKLKPINSKCVQYCPMECVIPLNPLARTDTRMPSSTDFTLHKLLTSSLQANALVVQAHAFQ
ncbi:SGNH hydrolase-type esterase domain containing protein [Parasponia andersonii]|uniref:SGNH hydrolase-type esterase domain containing protein n=1 Tax=Parasponia andersonii TaxID=3476 RepID=A0A2P5BA00_PARAD|nr:SGNH hydrolase-type esterase domain containing protein [Parasponia andersonii]